MPPKRKAAASARPGASRTDGAVPSKLKSTGVKRKLQQASVEEDTDEEEEEGEGDADEEEDTGLPSEVRCEVPVLFDKPRFLSILAETHQASARHWLTSDGRHLQLVELTMAPRELHTPAACALRGGSVLEHYFGTSAQRVMLMMTDALRPTCRSYENRDKTSCHAFHSHLYGDVQNKDLDAMERRFDALIAAQGVADSPPLLYNPLEEGVGEARGAGARAVTGLDVKKFLLRLGQLATQQAKLSFRLLGLDQAFKPLFPKTGKGRAKGPYNAFYNIGGPDDPGMDEHLDNYKAHGKEIEFMTVMIPLFVSEGYGRFVLIDGIGARKAGGAEVDVTYDLTKCYALNNRAAHFVKPSHCQRSEGQARGPSDFWGSEACRMVGVYHFAMEKKP